MQKFSEYLDTIKVPDHKNKLENIFNFVDENFPNLEKRIAWNTPHYTNNGTFIIGFSAFKNHFSISPEVKTNELFKDKIKNAGYGRTIGLFKILWTDDVDYNLLKEIIQYNINDKIDCKTYWSK